MSEDKEKNNENKPTNNTKEVIFETTYEKVLFIINKVKDFIKSIKDKETSKLEEELDWVIKVITNRDLYTYELVKDQLMKQDEGYEKFINFVKKYNEEVIEMNKKHNIVSSILNMRKKEEILLKPSLFLEKMDKIEEVQDKKKNNFVQTFGNYILNLYNEKNKKDENNSNILNNNSSKIDENSLNNNLNEQNNININKNENSSISITKHDKQEETKKDVSSPSNNNKILKSMIPNQKRFHLENNKILKNESLDKNINLNIQKIKFVNNKPNLKRKSNLKISNHDMQELAKKKYKEKMKLSRFEKNNFNQIKNLMRNYYLYFAYNEQFNSNSPPHLLKTDNQYNYYRNNNMSPQEYYKRYRYNQEKSYNLYKTARQGPLQFNFNNKNKYAYTNTKISLSLQTNNEINDERLEKINNNHKISKNHFKTEKAYVPSRSNEYKKSTLRNIKIENNNANKEHPNFNKHHFDINSKKIEIHIPLDSLINERYQELEKISTLDFNIFELKKKIGYNNVLPLLGYTILQILGLVDNKIISTKKLESFLKTVSDNYKETTLYHNSIHGADVSQSLLVFCLNSNMEEICETTVLDLLGMILSSIGHDLGHPGLNNGYHINASTELGITYNDISCLENFHSSFLFKIIRKEENNILEKFSIQNYKTIRKRMISQILATDMAFHGEICSKIKTKIKTRQNQERFIFLSGNDKTKFDEQQSLLNYLIHLADLGHNCKRFDISFSWVKLLCEEFWDQGDKEKEQGLPVSFLCDRNNVDVPTSQIGFIKGFIIPSFDSLVEMFPNLQFTTENAENNLKHWTKFQSEKKLLCWTPEKKKKDDKNKEEN